MKELIAQRLRDLAATATGAAERLAPDAERAGVDDARGAAERRDVVLLW